MNYSKLKTLLENNSIDERELEIKLYDTLVLGVFEALCKDIKKQGSLVEEKEKFRRSSDKTVVTKRIVDKYIGCSLGIEEYAKLAKYLSAFFRANKLRIRHDKSFRRYLLLGQDNRCAICNKLINEDNCHLDHIIPWNYVGDCLEDNYQMLCETCNERKGTSSYFEISMLLLNKKE